MNTATYISAVWFVLIAFIIMAFRWGKRERSMGLFWFLTIIGGIVMSLVTYWWTDHQVYSDATADVEHNIVVVEGQVLCVTNLVAQGTNNYIYPIASLQEYVKHPNYQLRRTSEINIFGKRTGSSINLVRLE